MTYLEKLKDPRWQKKRLEILDRDSWACQCCGNKKRTLHIHHKIYHKNIDPWDYDNIELATLCEICHEEEKESMNDLLTVLNYNLRKYFIWDDLANIMSPFIESISKFKKTKDNSVYLGILIMKFMEDKKFRKEMIKAIEKFTGGNNG